MTSALLTSLFLFGLFHPTPSATATTTYREGDWALTVEKDRFTGQARCRIADHRGRDPDITVVRGALAFHFDPRVDTEEAWYQIDDARVRSWRDDYAKLLSAGALIEAEHLDNPSGGVLLIPLADVRDARRITIQPAPKAALRKYRLGSLSNVLASAKGLGCAF